jgi:hypothetical protein
MIFIGLVGSLMDTTDKEFAEATPPPATATSVPEPTQTVCNPVAWSENFVEAHTLWGEVLTITQLDAIIVKYDTQKLPYGCGDTADRLMDEVDTEMRLGLGAHRTAFMLGEESEEGKLYFGQALRHYQTAAEKHEQWKGEIQ